MKQKIIFFITLLLGLGLFAFTLMQTGWDSVISTFKTFSLWGLILFISISTINFFIYTYRWYIITKSYDHKVPFWNLFWYRTVGYAVSYLTPAAQVGGEPMRIYFLKHDHNINVKTGLSIVFIDKILEVGAILLFVIIAFITTTFIGLEMQLSSFIFLIAIFIFLIAYAFFAITHEWGIFSTPLKIFQLHRITYIKKHFHKICETEKTITHFFHTHPKVLFTSIILSIVTQCVIVLENYVILRFLNITPTLTEVFLIAVIPNLAYIIPTPAALGMLEGSTAGLFRILKITSISAIAYTLIIRMRDLTFVTLGTIYGVTHGIKFFKK